MPTSIINPIAVWRSPWERQAVETRRPNGGRPHPASEVAGALIASASRQLRRPIDVAEHLSPRTTLVPVTAMPILVRSALVTGRAFASLVVGALLVAPSCGGSDSGVDATTTSAAASTSTSAASGGVDLTKLPIGDQQYAASAVKGSVYSCITQFNGGGAFRDGPWIDADTKTWDATAKIAVKGSLDLHGQIIGKESTGGEMLTGNGLPTVPTGVFPVASSDPAYAV